VTERGRERGWEMGMVTEMGTGRILGVQQGRCHTTLGTGPR
jgi:hypothetical protein